jgi:hypothetical protein
MLAQSRSNREWGTYIISAEDAHDFAAAIELNKDALLEVLLEVSIWEACAGVVN